MLQALDNVMTTLISLLLVVVDSSLNNSGTDITESGCKDRAPVRLLGKSKPGNRDTERRLMR